MNENLKDIKKSLENALGPEDFERYLKLLKKWFSQSLTKEQFDTQARKLIPREKIHHHNQFFVAILSKCNIQYLSTPSLPSGASSSNSSSSSTTQGGKRKFQALKQLLNKTGSRGAEKRFRTSEPIQTGQPPKQVQTVQDIPSPISDNLTVCTKDGLLPDRSTMFGRALVIAWEAGLEEIDESSVELLVLATRDLMKNVLHSAIQLRRNFVVSGSGFPHLFGVNSSLATANSLTAVRTISQPDLESSQCVAASRSPPLGQISLRDIYDGLQMRPDILPCQTVSSVVLERILCKQEEKSKDTKSG